MQERFIRTGMLLGSDGVERLRQARVAVFGLGGVGGHAAEALARAGVGHIELIDSDTVSESNLNRQIFAVQSTLGMKKTEAALRRLRDAAPDGDFVARDLFFGPLTAGEFDMGRYDYVADAVDTVTAKLLIAELCCAAGTPVISCMGTGNKLDPTALCVADISETAVCPLARVMRRELKKRGISRLRVVYSREEPAAPLFSPDETDGRRAVPGSVPFVPACAGLIMAGEIIKHLALGPKPR